MSVEFFVETAPWFLLIALLYATVGHAGASGYLALMALLAFPSDQTKPASLLLNILVSLIAAYKFIRAGYFDLRIFLPFMLASVPLAFLGGAMALSPDAFRLFAGIFLILSAILLLIRGFIAPSDAVRPAPLWLSLSLGGLIGFVSGLIGVGGGIFLSPLLILGRWTTVRQASGISALFILVNSLTALAGHLTRHTQLDPGIMIWGIAVIAGGWIGAELGTRKLNPRIILGLLFVVLMSAGIKFVFRL